MCLKRPSFLPVASGDVQDGQAVIMRGHISLDSKGIFSASLWVWIALALLLMSNALFFTSFVTNHWGIVHTENGTYWEVGLWQSCRYNSHQDLCIGPGWPPFYSAARSFMVMGLFGHVLLFAWLIGYALEKLLDYDPCTVGCLVALSFSTAVFMIIALCSFGVHWPPWVRSQYAFVESVKIDYSLWVAVPCVFLLIIVGVLLIVEIRTSLLRLLDVAHFLPRSDKQGEMQHPFSFEEEDEVEYEVDRIPTIVYTLYSEVMEHFKQLGRPWGQYQKMMYASWTLQGAEIIQHIQKNRSSWHEPEVDNGVYL